MKKLLRIFAVAVLAAFASAATAFAANTDVLTNATTGVSGTSYKDWTYTSTESGAVYVGQSAGGNESIQLRSKNSNSGIITTTSGGSVKKITIDWDSNTSSGQTLDVYGNNTVYTSIAELYDTEGNSNQGTKLGSIVCGTSTELEVSGDYKYVGLRSKSGALYLASISIVWKTDGDIEEETVAVPEISATATDFEESTTVTITAEDGTAIYYTLDGTAPTAESTAYSAPFDVTATATVKAIAVKGGKTSSVASLALTKVDVTSMTFAEAYAWCLEQDYTKSVKHDGYVKITFEDAKVLYVDETAIFVRQGEMAMQFYGFPTSEKAVVANDILNGTYIGQLQAYKGIPELSASTKITTAANVTVTNSEEAAAAISATVAEIEARTYICDLVELTNVTFTKDDQDYFWVNSGDNDVEVKVTNDLIPEEYVNKLYNVKAVVSSTYKNEGVLALLSCEYVGAATPVDDIFATELEENAPIYNMQGQRVDKNAKGILIQNGKKFVVK